MRNFYILLLFIQFHTHVLAQHPFYYTINDENGLPSNEVYQLAQDNFGFIWIGCDAGLFRYDGFNFVLYENKYQNSRSISHLKKDPIGNIWCQNFTGQIFRTDGDSLKLIADLSGMCRQFPQYTIDGKGNLWTITDSVLLNYRNDGQLISTTNCRKFNSKLKLYFSDIEYEKRSDKILVLTLNHYLYTFKPDEVDNFNVIKVASYTGQRSSIIPTSKKTLIYTEFNPDRKYILSELTKEQLVKLNEEKPANKNGVNYTINQTSTDEFWLATSGGAIRLNQNFEKYSNYPVLFKDSKISSVMRDNENNYWFTSLQDGIFIVPAIHLQIYNKETGIIKDQNISALTKINDSTIYFGDYSGNLYSLTIGNKKIEQFNDKNDNVLRPVRKITTYKNKIISARGPFFIRNGGEESMFPNINTVRDFVIDQDTVYYVSSDRCGYLTFINQQKSEILVNIGGKCVAVHEKEKTVYFGTTDGLIASNKKGKREVSMNGAKIIATKLHYINNEIWAGTLNKGILIIKNQNECREFKYNSSIKGNTIRCFKIYDGIIYISTEKGLNCISLNNGDCKFYNSNDGLVYTEINEIEILNNRIYLATIKGLIELPINTQFINNKSPGIKITSIKLNGTILPVQPILNLEYGTQNIEINFIGTGFRSRGQFNYTYQLKGLENIWHTTNSEFPQINYSFLPPGEYELQVYTVNEDGIKSRQPARIKIYVEQPFWQKWWFYVAIAFATASVVALFFQLRIKYLKRQSIIKNKIILSQLTALKAQMNPHFMFNTLNSIQDLILKSDIKNTNYYLSRFSTLMRKVLEASGHNEIVVQEEIEMLNLYLELEKLRFGNDFEFNIQTSIGSDESRLYIPSMIIQPFVENAMKHGLLHKKGIKLLDLNFSESNGKLICVITDNGIGIKKALEIKNRSNLTHKSFATKATEKRLELINSTRAHPIVLTIAEAYPNTENPGTQVTIEIPIR